MGGRHLGVRRTFRFAPSTMSSIRAAAAERGTTPGAVVRECVRAFLECGQTLQSARTSALTVALPLELVERLDAAADSASTTATDVAVQAVLWALSRG
jgi:hypothetical protein